jgi:hypothetical protein
MDRAEFLTLIDVARQRGLEIGALNHPIVTRAMGPVEYVDRASRADLAAWFADPIHDVDPADLVEVDHIWGEQSLLECVGGQRAYDYLITSHVIEHVPDVFGWLGEIASVLRDGGLALFVVPDKRFTFDQDRRPSVSGDFVDAYVRRLRRPDTRQIFNHYYDTRHIGAAPPDEAEATGQARTVLELCRRVELSGEYIDGHCWVFTPRTILQALDLANRIGVLPFEIACLSATAPGDMEFFLALRRLPDRLDAQAQRAAFVASRDAIILPDESDAPAAPASPDEAVIREAEAALARAAAIENSTIWRMTAPLRRLIDLARGRTARAS